MFILFANLNGIAITPSLNSFSRKNFTILCAFATFISAYASTIVPPNEQLILGDIQQQVSAARLEKDVTSLEVVYQKQTFSGENEFLYRPAVINI